MAADKKALQKHMKALARKKVRGRKKIEKEKKIKLTQKQIDQAMANMERMESRRRIAILEYLVEKGFDENKKKMEVGDPVFVYKRTHYKLKKVNYTEKMKALLEADLGKYQGIYMITDIKTEKLGLIFQVKYSGEKKEFEIATLEEKL